MAEGRQIRAGLERSKQIRDTRAELKADVGKPVAKKKSNAIEIVDQTVTRITNEDAKEALKIAESGYEGFTESEDDLN
ncbi:MAG: hypothetical protein A2563_00200 [Candidatus Magasanikbacteria bacterium RIFOXYD1_FULL_40_23]|uniref:Uncharacterized protein n=1 Tax=Candidatus Magasanikbacteria bacterium RIFOXYD1_FULL_40_23 TaxID=1798705 RepID=A0A1F6PAB3_9BACT|nr:MAG: hypothetical protein A2563_00200 [Candidatus Magasanikbacteria bacterium RIFOXYD1_FULL_40_23]